MPRHTRSYPLANARVHARATATVPPGAAVVRPSVRAATSAPAAEGRARALDTGATAWVRTEADGTHSVELRLDGDVFPGLTCVLGRDGHGAIVAVFRVRDRDAQRLLEGARSRLYAGLEARGLRVARVEVVMERP